jgi:hypothetical protein
MWPFKKKSRVVPGKPPITRDVIVQALEFLREDQHAGAEHILLEHSEIKGEHPSSDNFYWNVEISICAMMDGNFWGGIGLLLRIDLKRLTRECEEMLPLINSYEEFLRSANENGATSEDCRYHRDILIRAIDQNFLMELTRDL